MLTHNHDDHISGVQEILATYPATPVYGPAETESVTNGFVLEGDSFERLGQNIQVFKTVGHTAGHISYLMGEALFCGDALFSDGCGRVFTGDYQAQFAALQTFDGLDNHVQVYAAHEYTQTDLHFAQSVQPSNQTITEALNRVNDLRAQGLPTLPSTSLQTFITLRKARDDF